MKGLEKLPTLLSTGDWTAAEAVLKRAVKSRPSEAPLLYNLGKVLIEQGKWAPARHWLRLAVRAAPKHQAAWFELGRTLLELAEFREAAEAFWKSSRLDPNDLEARRLAGRLALRLGEYEFAREAWLPLDGKDIEADCALYRVAAETDSLDAVERRQKLLARKSDRAAVLKALTRTAKGRLPLGL